LSDCGRQVEFCSRGDVVLGEEAFIDLQGVKYLRAARSHSCFVKWLEGMDFQEDTIGIKESNVERNGSIFHPETYFLG